MVIKVPRKKRVKIVEENEAEDRMEVQNIEKMKPEVLGVRRSERTRVNKKQDKKNKLNKLNND